MGWPQKPKTLSPKASIPCMDCGSGECLIEAPAGYPCRSKLRLLRLGVEDESCLVLRSGLCGFGSSA